MLTESQVWRFASLCYLLVARRVGGVYTELLSRMTSGCFNSSFRSPCAQASDLERLLHEEAVIQPARGSASWDLSEQNSRAGTASPVGFNGKITFGVGQRTATAYLADVRDVDMAGKVEAFL